MIVAVDGPAASGKGTLAKRIAGHYSLPHLDTGLLYRAVAFGLLERGGALDDRQRAAAVAAALDPREFDEKALKTQRVGDAASVVSAFSEVRDALLALQRAFATNEAGAVLDGRDIGTVICPNATVKLFVTASPEERARRRAAELVGRDEAANFQTVLQDIMRRDERDRSRSVAPLLMAADAHLLDTTHLDIDGAFRAAIAIVEAARAG